jgi:hypothetical protein
MEPTDSAAIELSPATDAVSPGAPLRTDVFVLTGQQLELYRALSEKSEKAAGWYHGGLIAFSNASNPERFVQAAHSIRELIKNLHKFIDVPAKSDKARMGDKFRTLADRWDKAKKKTSCHDGKVWEGRIDDHLRRGLAAVDEAIEWLRVNRPTVRETSIALIRGLDVSRRRLPPSLETTHYTEWKALYDYFVAVCHHDRETDENEFSTNLYAFERFVLDRVRPKTLKEQTLIDQLIAEAEDVH